MGWVLNYFKARRQVSTVGRGQVGVLDVMQDMLVGKAGIVGSRSYCVLPAMPWHRPCCQLLVSLAVLALESPGSGEGGKLRPCLLMSITRCRRPREKDRKVIPLAVSFSVVAATDAVLPRLARSQPKAAEQSTFTLEGLVLSRTDDQQNDQPIFKCLGPKRCLLTRA